MIDAGMSVIPVAADLETDEGVATVMERVRKTRGNLHGLVTVIGGGAPPTWGPSTKLSRGMWDTLFSQNLDSMFFISQAIAAELKAQGRPGSMVSISSITGVGNMPYNIGYGAAKAAVLSVVRTLALELVRLLDGSRDREALVRDLAARMARLPSPAGDAGDGGSPRSADWWRGQLAPKLEDGLRQAASMALLLP